MLTLWQKIKNFFEISKPKKPFWQNKEVLMTTSLFMRSTNKDVVKEIEQKFNLSKKQLSSILEKRRTSDGNGKQKSL